jgi:hypothetical protein
MSKERNKSSGVNVGHGKVTVFFAQVEGNNDTLQSALVTIAEAVEKAGGRPGISRAAVPQVLARGPARDASTHSTEAADTSAEERLEDAAAEDLIEPATPGNKPRSQRNPVTPNIVELDLISGNLPLKTFITQKGSPEETTKRYLLIAHWLKEERKIDSITCDHIYTCYRHLNWSVPSDIGITLRNGKSRGIFNKAGTKGAYMINHIGQNRVNEMV